MDDYHTQHLLRMYEYIFEDLFEWAGVREEYILLEREISEPPSRFDVSLQTKWVFP